MAEAVSAYQRLRDDLADLPSGSSDGGSLATLIHLVDKVIGSKDDETASGQKMEASESSEAGAAPESSSAERSLWQELPSHREGSEVRTAVVRWAMEDFEAFLTICDGQFTHPDSRLDILILLLSVIYAIPYAPGSPASDTPQYRLVGHPFLLSIIHSLIYDTSNALFPIALRTLLVCMPFAPLALTPHVPLLMIILGRANCWRDRPFVDAASQARDAVTRTPLPSPDTEWQVATAAAAPEATSALALQPKRVARLWLVATYSAWPSNVIAFVRDPVPYLKGKSIAPLYVVDWEKVWPEKLLATRTGPLIADFALHPSLIHFTSAAELADARRWDKSDPSEFIATSHRIAHSELLSGGMFGFLDGEPFISDRDPFDLEPVAETAVGTPAPGAITTTSDENDLERLRRENEILLLEAKFGERVRKQMHFHIGRLHKNSLRFNSDEAEIHSFVNRLKEQSKTIAALETELSTQREEASAAKRKHTNWQEDLRKKNDAFRAERKQWQTDAATLRSELDELQALTKRQKDELAVVKNDRFKLQNELIAIKPSVARIEDYEVRMKQLTETQRLWDEDLHKCEAATAEAETWRGRCYQVVRVLEKDKVEQAEKIRRLEATHASSLTPPRSPRPADKAPKEAPGLHTVIAAAASAKKRADALDRENIEASLREPPIKGFLLTCQQVKVEVERLRRSIEEKARLDVEHDRSFIWGNRSASPSIFPV